MARPGLAVSGRTLDVREGYAGLSWSNLAFRVRRTALTVLAAGALIAGVAATSAAVKGVAQSGVRQGDTSGRLTEVSPTGYAWRAGLRPLQTVDIVIAADEPGGWRMEALDGTVRHIADGPTADAALGASQPFGLVAVVVALLAVVFLRTRRRWVLPAAATGLLAASIPLQLEGGAGLSTVVMAGAALVPTVSFGLRLPGGLRAHVVVVAGLAALVAAWAVARLTGADGFDDAEAIRRNVALLATATLVVDRGLLPTMTGQPVRLVRPRLFDVLAIAGLAMATLGIGVVLRFPPLETALLLVASFALVLAARRRLGRPIENMLLADVRLQAAADATEVERARLARELHDVPLQELAAVIRRLEILPGAEAESEDLRALAGHLRNVATELRPPVLDDLGLPAALDYLAEETTTPAIVVTADVEDHTGFGTEHRPPTEVELAMFRIASEAVGNAIRHSGGSRIRVRASVAPDRVELEVTDDGEGLATDAASSAAKRKRLGLASMRRRAEAIDAELSIDGSRRGTTVRVAWQA
jgi:signal transduction histidine kinase